MFESAAVQDSFCSPKRTHSNDDSVMRTSGFVCVRLGFAWRPRVFGSGVLGWRVFGWGVLGWRVFGSGVFGWRVMLLWLSSRFFVGFLWGGCWLLGGLVVGFLEPLVVADS